MSDANTISAIIEQYERNGWTLRRVLAGPDEDFFVFIDIGEAEVVRGEHNGLWFSRRSKNDAETWELRRLKGLAFALIAVIKDDMTPAETEEILSGVESEMFNERG